MYIDDYWAVAKPGEGYRGYYKVRPCFDSAGQNPMPFPRHDGKCNTLWVDGHATALLGNTAEDMYNFWLSDPWHKGGLDEVAWFRNPNQ